MAIPIIGETKQDAPKALPEPEVALPGPETVPAAHRVFDDAALEAFLTHEDPLVRGFGIEQAQAAGSPALGSAILARLDDDDPFVFSEALSAVVEQGIEGGAAKVRALFAEASGPRASGLAAALGRLDPDALPDAVRAHGRLDDEAFPSVTTALAVTATAEAEAFFDKALGRAPMLSPDRRQALFTAVLVLGSERLAGRVLGEAIGDSNREAPDRDVFPSRVAVAGLGGLTADQSRIDAGEEVFAEARKVLEEDAGPELDDDARAALTEALRAQRAGDALRALAPLAERALEDRPEEVKDLGTIPRRRQGLLRALIGRARDVERLEPSAAAIFLAAAAQAASLVVATSSSEASSEAITSLAEALGEDAASLAEADEVDLAARFERRSAREMRRAHTIVARQSFRRASTFRRVVRALLRAGHGAGLVTAAAEVEEPALHQLIGEAAAEVVADAEEAILEVLDERPLDPKSATLALTLGERLRTERIGLAVAARFFELRAIAKGPAARLLAYVGRQDFIPLLESRAFEGEPEEAGWVLLSLAHGREATGALKDALERIRQRRYQPPSEPLEVELSCSACGEAGLYGFERAYVDPEGGGDTGDPAFVGDTVCKACGAEDTLTPTEIGTRILVSHMMRFLESMQAGVQADPIVIPQTTTVDGKTMGLAAALRALDAQVEASPDGIRTRLERGRLRMLLRRRGVEEDIAAIRDRDPDSVEATVLEGTQAARSGAEAAAVQLLAEAHARLSSEDEPRVYDAASPEALREGVEDLLLELSG